MEQVIISLLSALGIAKVDSVAPFWEGSTQLIAFGTIKCDYSAAQSFVSPEDTLFVFDKTDAGDVTFRAYIQTTYTVSKQAQPKAEPSQVESKPTK